MFRNGAKTAVLLAALGGVMVGVGSLFGRGGAIIGLILGLAVVGFVLVVINAAFAGTELAMVSLCEGQLQRLERRSGTGALLARQARQPNQFLATIQIGITLAGFLPRPLAFLSKLTRPVLWLLSHSTDIAVRLMGGDPKVQREEVTEAELRDMVAVLATFTAEQLQIIDGAFEIAERTLDEILVPRRDVFVIDASWSCGEALARLAESGHSRAPVADGGSLDQVSGAVHLRQLLGGGDQPASAVAIVMPMFPESAKALHALRQMQAGRVQMALVVDEHGGESAVEPPHSGR